MANEERVTPFNRPMPQWQTPAPEDPTAAPLVEGGSLKLKPLDRKGFENWFQQSFMNQFGEDSWFIRNWFPAVMEPIYKAFNDNFDEINNLVSKNTEEVAEFRLEVLGEVAKAHAEMAKVHAEIVTINKEMIDGLRKAVNQEINSWIATRDKQLSARIAEVRQRALAKCSEDINIIRDDLLNVLRREMIDLIVKENADWVKVREVELSKHTQTAVETTRAEMMAGYNADLKSMHENLLHTLRQELAQEIVKMRSKEVKGKK